MKNQDIDLSDDDLFSRVLARNNPKKALTGINIDSLILKAFNRECKHKHIDKKKLIQAFMFDYVTDNGRLINFK